MQEQTSKPNRPRRNYTPPTTRAEIEEAIARRKHKIAVILRTSKPGSVVQEIGIPWAEAEIETLYQTLQLLDKE